MLIKEVLDFFFFNGTVGNSCILERFLLILVGKELFVEVFLEICPSGTLVDSSQSLQALLMYGRRWNVQERCGPLQQL